MKKENEELKHKLRNKIAVTPAARKKNISYFEESPNSRGSDNENEKDDQNAEKKDQQPNKLKDNYEKLKNYYKTLVNEYNKLKEKDTQVKENYNEFISNCNSCNFGDNYTSYKSIFL